MVWSKCCQDRTLVQLSVTLPRFHRLGWAQYLQLGRVVWCDRGVASPPFRLTLAKHTTRSREESNLYDVYFVRDE